MKLGQHKNFNEEEALLLDLLVPVLQLVDTYIELLRQPLSLRKFRSPFSFRFLTFTLNPVNRLLRSSDLTIGSLA